MEHLWLPICNAQDVLPARCHIVGHERPSHSTEMIVVALEVEWRLLMRLISDEGALLVRSELD